MRKYLLTALLLALPGPALAQSILALPPASAPTGTEKIIAAQGPGCATNPPSGGACTTVVVTPTQIGTFLGTATLQPKDADLDAVAALTTTTFGRSLLTQASAAAARTTLGVVPPTAQVPTLNSPWINYGGGFQSVRYFIGPDNKVTIEGLIQATTGSSTTGVTLFTLAAGYRPQANMMFNVWGGGGACRMDVNSDGTVVMQGCNTVFTSFAGISFYAG